jgi:hypothetical protein
MLDQFKLFHVPDVELSGRQLQHPPGGFPELAHPGRTERSRI